MLVGDAIPEARRGLHDLDEAILHELKRRGYCADDPFVPTAELMTGAAFRARPHVYDRIVALAQDFTTRYPLIDGEGNFGSYDDDPPAEPRYTEVRLSRAGEAAADDGRFPSLLANGLTGSRSVIPPHNIQGIALVVHAVMLDPEADVVRLADLIGAPDFPTGGIITGGDPLAQIYASGRGRIVLEGRMHIDTPSRLVITELPYGVAKGGENGLIRAIAELVHDRRLTGIASLGDDSSRAGMRISIKLQRDASCDEVVQALLELTQLRTTIDVDMVAAVDGAPRTMGLRQLAKAYLDHRRSVLGPDSDNRIRAELGQLATQFASPRRTAVAA